VIDQALNYYLDLIDKKLGLRGDTAVRRIEAVCAGDWEKVEFLEQMILKPLSRQIYYLSGKLLELLKKEGE
jgi:hypothetical protein